MKSLPQTETKLEQLSSKLIKNTDNINKVEVYLKRAVIAVVIAYLIYKNASSEPIKPASFPTSSPMNSELRLFNIIADMKKELIIFIVTVSLLAAAMGYNAYLDRLEREEDGAKKTE